MIDRETSQRLVTAVMASQSISKGDAMSVIIIAISLNNLSGISELLKLDDRHIEALTLTMSRLGIFSAVHQLLESAKPGAGKQLLVHMKAVAPLIKQTLGSKGAPS